MTVSLEQFVEHLTQSGLMSTSEVSSFQDTLPPERKPKDGEALARELVRANRLTKYQAQAVYQGKTKGLVFGEYVVMDKLGQGGMGVVLKAQHRRMKRFVAVKMIAGKAIGSPDAVKRFYREVEAAAKLNHPNIVQAHDASEHDGVHYLVMEYVEGKDLAAIVKDRGPMAVHAAVECIRQVARGLQYAHKQGIVHRDIKPSNLLMDKEGTVKILDMGLARIAGLADDSDQDRLTSSGQVIGTCDYMAPEQALDTHHADARADMYSLGCTLYRLLTGHVPYRGETQVQVFIAHRESPIPSICKERPDVPPQLDAVFQKMVAKDPEHRYQSMTEVIIALETCEGKRSASARSVGEEPTAAFAAEDNLSFLQGATPGSRTTATEKKVERRAGVTLWQQASAEETGKQLGRNARLLAVVRTKMTLAVGIGLGLLGVVGIVALAVTIRIRHPDGKETVVRAPEGSDVSIGRDGQVDVTLPKAESGNVDAVKTAGSVTATKPGAIKPWFPGSEPGDTPPEPPPGPPPVFGHEDLHQFLTKTFKPMRTPQLWRMLYTEIATTIDRGQPGRPATWTIGGALTSDGKAYEIAVRAGEWFPRVVPPSEVAEKGLTKGISRSVQTPWRMPVKELVRLSEPELRLVQGADGSHTLAGRIRCVADSEQPIEHLALVIEFPSDKEDATNTLYQQYRITEIPSGWLEVKLGIDPAVNLKHAPRIYLQAFLARPAAGFFRISNELLWMSEAKLKLRLTRPTQFASGGGM